MGHTGTGPHGSSNCPSFGRHPDLGPLQEFPLDLLKHKQEMCSISKDSINYAINALQAALNYMPQIKTDVPQWQEVVEKDTARIQSAIVQLRKFSPQPYG